MANLHSAAWRNDPATPAQIRTLRLKFKYYPENGDWSALKKGEAADLLDNFFKALPPKEEDSATQPQIDYIKKLCEWTYEDPDEWLADLNRANVGKRIAELKQLRLDRNNRELTNPDLEEGMYLFRGEIYRVRMSKAHVLRAYQLVQLDRPVPASNGERTHQFIYARNLIRILRAEHRMTKEQAVAFGQEHSCCVRCATPLDPNILTKDGKRRHIGPECEKEWA